MKYIRKRPFPKGWTLWSARTPTKPGYYWLAGWWSHEGCGDVEEPGISKVMDHHLNGTYSIVNERGYDEENLIWKGPLIAPIPREHKRKTKLLAKKDCCGSNAFHPYQVFRKPTLHPE